MGVVSVHAEEEEEEEGGGGVTEFWREPTRTAILELKLSRYLLLYLNRRRVVSHLRQRYCSRNNRWITTVPATTIPTARPAARPGLDP